MKKNISIALISSVFILAQNVIFSFAARQPSSQNTNSNLDFEANLTQCADILIDENSRDLQREIGIADVAIRSPNQVCVNQSFALDASESRYPAGHNVKFFWDFGNGSAQTGVKVKKSYSRPGDYPVTLTVRDFSGGPCSIKKETKIIHVNQPPIARAGEDSVGCVGENIRFDGSGSQSFIPGALFAQWDFGDASQEKDLIAEHSYKSPGTYSVTLTARDSLAMSCGESMDQKTVRIFSSPKVSLQVSQTKLCPDQELELKAMPEAKDKGRLNYFWSFDDGMIIKAGPLVRHRFTKTGSYKVSVAVDDGRGTPCSSDSAFVQISVFPPEQCANGNIKF